MPRRLLSILSFLLICSAAVPARMRISSSTANPQVASSPETSRALQRLIETIFAAAKAKDKDKEAELIRNLVMPENTTWFTDEFGPGFGHSLTLAYRKLVPDLEEEIRTIYEGDVERGWTTAKVIRYEDPASTDSPTDNFLNCMEHIVPLYQTAIAPGGRTSFYFGPPPRSTPPPNAKCRRPGRILCLRTGRISVHSYSYSADASE